MTNWITEARLAHEGASMPRPLCSVCDKPYAEHGSYPTCASHPYSPDGRCGHVGTFSDGRFTGLPCMGAECRNGCARAAGVAAVGQGEPLGRCCYGGTKRKRDCASCAAWTPIAGVMGTLGSSDA